jgi:hypothetical protein
MNVALWITLPQLVQLELRDLLPQGHLFFLICYAHTVERWVMMQTNVSSYIPISGSTNHSLLVFLLHCNAITASDLVMSRKIVTISRGFHRTEKEAGAKSNATSTPCGREDYYSLDNQFRMDL